MELLVLLQSLVATSPMLTAMVEAFSAAVMQPAAPAAPSLACEGRYLMMSCCPCVKIVYEMAHQLLVVGSTSMWANCQL